MDLVFPVASFVLALAATSRSLGLGLGTVVAFGYFNGIIRANYLGVFSTFMFDFGVTGFYLGTYLFWSHRMTGIWTVPGAGWVLFLTLWPAALSLIPVNDLLVQLVALRGTIWYLPVLLIAARLRNGDLNTYARMLAVMNVVVLPFGVYEYLNGIEVFFPNNAVTRIMYMSNDVSGGYHRIPATFNSAHSYGGTMLFGLPILIDRVFGTRVGFVDRVLGAAGLLAAAAGILLCAARTPALFSVILLVVTWSLMRFNLWFGLGIAVVLFSAVAVAMTDDRLQRAATLEDTNFVSDRIKGSANDNFFELVAQYPGGAGMGSSVGTSIPFFLADRAPEQVGLENEYSRILVDQGWIGLGGWVAFLVWLFMTPPSPKGDQQWRIGILTMYALCVVTWSLAFMGTGAMTSIPGSVMMMTMMGVLLQTRANNQHEVDPGKLRHRAKVTA